jgi:hypothetical protein
VEDTDVLDENTPYIFRMHSIIVSLKMDAVNYKRILALNTLFIYACSPPPP